MFDLPGSFHVFPLHTPVEGGCSCRHEACRNVGKHPRTMNGYKDATNNAAKITEWWDMWPGANVGVACGPSGLIVIDIDPRHGGDDSLRDLIAGREWPETPTVITGGGGTHYYFKAPRDSTIGNSTGLLGPGIDVRAQGGYVVAPPSMHESGRSYEWEAGLAPGEVKGATAPAWLIEMLSAPGSRGRRAAEAINDVIPEGHRDQTLTSLAGSMRRRGMSPEGILAALRVENRRCVPPLPERDLERIASSVGRYAPASDIPVKTGLVTYANLRKRNTTPPTYILEISGGDLRLTTAQLVKFHAVRIAAIEQLDLMLPAMKQQEWDEQLEHLLNNLDVLPAPEDASEPGVIWHAIRDYLTTYASDDEEHFKFRPLSRGNEIFVTGDMIRRALRQRGFDIKQPQIWELMSERGATKKNVRINDKQSWIWSMPDESLSRDSVSILAEAT